MNITVDIQAALKEYLHKKFPCEKVDERLVNFLFSTGALDKKNILRFLVKSRYHDLLKANSSARSARLDCSIEFGVGETFVTNVVYHNRKIRP